MKKNKDKDVLAAVLSFLITGTGQIYKGKVLRGLAFFIGVIIGSFFFLIPGLCVWIWSIIDAYNLK